MSLSPYLFEPKTPNSKHFEQMIADHKTWYFWAQILETGTAVCHTTVSTAHDSIIYFIVDPSMDNHPCIHPEEFIGILAGREENAMFWGYSWTIKEMAANWHRLICMRYGKTNYNVNDYSLKIDHASKKLEIISKAQIWKGIEEINF